MEGRCVTNTLTLKVITHTNIHCFIYIQVKRASLLVKVHV